MSVAPYAVAVWLLVVGLYGVVTSDNLIHLVVCLGVAQSSTYVLLLSIGYRSGATAPVYDVVPPGAYAVDPIVQSLVLTDVVVGAAVTALLLALAVQVHKRTGTLDPDHIDAQRG
jgi:multicomponent Na+:H+ antiporter subunit C